MRQRYGVASQKTLLRSRLAGVLVRVQCFHFGIRDQAIDPVASQRATVGS